VAGWGFVAAAPSAQCAGQPLAFQTFFGPVVASPGGLPVQAKAFTNNTAELSAIAAALRWLLAGQLQPQPVNILFDSTWAANQVRRIWRPKSHRHAIVATQRLLDKVGALGFSLTWHHVRAHRGHFLNEAADRAAAQGAAACRQAV